MAKFREISRQSLENFAKCEIKISRNISRNSVSRNFAGHPRYRSPIPGRQIWQTIKEDRRTDRAMNNEHVIKGLDSRVENDNHFASFFVKK
jgi:hypothetical protein